ncbi:hypothetical protein PLESTF_000157100 [Pleodorina starrii]|nr:hypothetical protein PLESTF_000157100 [Pleodorina starrii]
MGAIHMWYDKVQVDELPFVMAYRGASADFPEHSIGAYRAAIKQGARFIECDVVLSRDLVPVCRHEPNIAHTTDVLLRWPRRRGGSSSSLASEQQQQQHPTLGGGQSEGPVVLASDLTLEEIKQLRAVFPGSLGDAAVATSGAQQPPPPPSCRAGEAEAPAAEGECAAPWVSGSIADEVGPRGQEAAGGGTGVEEAGTGADGLTDHRVASLEDLLRMATVSTAAVDPAVGVALHIQSASWHNAALPQLAAANSSFEDVLLRLLQRYGYAAGPYGSEAWRRRPSYIMAFEASSLKNLARLTSSPLTQVLGPTIPDTGEGWDSATGPEGLARIAAYASSVAVARQQLLATAQSAAAAVAAGPAQAEGETGRGGDGGGRGLVASEPLLRMRRAGLQVFASVFKPAPREQLLTGAETWVDEVAPLVLGTGLIQGVGGGGGGQGGAGEAEAQGAGGRLGAAIDGLFTDSPGELRRVLERLSCGDGGGGGGGDGDGDGSGGTPADV